MPFVNLANEEVKLSLTETSMAAYALIKTYLMLRKRVELLKHEWGKRGLDLEDVNTYANFKVMKESLTVPRPALVDEFLENLKSGVREDMKRKAITFDTDHLNEVIQNIANNVMRMQREAYEW
nr:coiled coil domain containing protein 162 [Hymenolepis microstoma]